VYASEACTFYIDGYQVEKKAYPTSTCIGSLAWCDWAGAADASTSTRAATEVNLDDYASLLSDNDTWSLSLWWQPQYDTDATWPSEFTVLFNIYEDATNRVTLQFEESTGEIELQYAESGSAFANYVLDFSAGDLVHILYTIDTAGDASLYLNGILRSTVDISAKSSISPVTMRLGSYTDANPFLANALYSEFALFDRVLTAAEVAAIYQSGAPLTDQGTTDVPVVAGDMVQLQISTANVSNPPTDAELTEAFGTPRNGFMALVDDADAGTTIWKVWRAADAWWYEELTEAV